MSIEPIPFIRELCKHKTEEEILEAEERWREYLLLIQEIVDLEEENGTEAPLPCTYCIEKRLEPFVCLPIRGTDMVHCFEDTPKKSTKRSAKRVKIKTSNFVGIEKS